MAKQWVDITTINNATPFMKVRWKADFLNITDAWFAEAPNLVTDGMRWTEGTKDYGWFSAHRMNYNCYSCSFDFEHTATGYWNVSGVVYQDSVCDGLRNQYYDTTVEISGVTYYEVDFSLWSGASNYQLYAPYSVMPWDAGDVFVEIGIDDITIDKDRVSFKSSGGTKTITVDAVDDWTAVVDGNWITASALSGSSGTTVVSITAPAYSDTTTARTGSITFSCGQDSVVLPVRQSKASSGGLHNILLGATEVSGVFMGTKEIQTIYLGSQEVYTAGPAVITLKYKAPSQITPNVAYTDSAWTATFSAETYDSATSAGTVTFIDAGSGLTIPNGAYSSETTITEFIIPKKVTAIGDDAFQSVYGLTGTMVIPKTVTTIGERAFYACSALTEVFVPDSVTSDLTECFQNCSSLTEVHLSSAMTAIGECMCQNCRSLTGVTIPEGVTSIGEYAFFLCPHISAVTIPAAVTSIDVNAFSQFDDATDLCEITFKGDTPPTTYPTAFSRVASAGTIYCSASAVTTYTTWKSGLSGNITAWSVESDNRLPNKPFMFNYNAKQYDPTTYTFPKTQGQLFNQDLVLNQAPAGYNELTVDFRNNTAWMGVTYPTAADNPFNRYASATTLTAIYRVKGFNDSSHDIFACRDNSNYNYMVRGNMLHTAESGYLQMAPNVSNSYIMMVRIKANGNGERSRLGLDGTVEQTVTASTVSWGSPSNAFGFFSGYGTQIAEPFNAIFLWAYLSNEELTDAEVQQVINYNENL